MIRPLLRPPPDPPRQPPEPRVRWEPDPEEAREPAPTLGEIHAADRREEAFRAAVARAESSR